MLSLVLKIANLVLLALFAFTLGSSLSTLSFSTLLQGSIASLLSALSCWVALVAAVWSALVAFMPSIQWRGLPWLVLGAAVSCAAFWLWNSASGNAQAVCSSISFLADLCGSAITRWVFMGLFIVSVVLQLLVWRYTANKLGGGDGTKLMSLGAGRRASSSSSGGGGGTKSLAARWRSWRHKDGAAQAVESDEEHELGGAHAGRGAWSEGSASASEEEPKRRKRGGGSRRSSYAPVGRVEAVESGSEEEHLPGHRSRK